MAYNTSGLLGPGFTQLDTDAKHTLGTVVKGTDGTEWCYVQANGAITQYNYVCIDENYQAVKGTTALVKVGHKIAFAQVAFADNDYGWVALGGSNISCLVATSCAADVTLWTTATAGVLDDATGTALAKIQGVMAVAAVDTAAATEVIASYPHYDDAVTQPA